MINLLAIAAKINEGTVDWRLDKSYETIENLSKTSYTDLQRKELERFERLLFQRASGLAFAPTTAVLANIGNVMPQFTRQNCAISLFDPDSWHFRLERR